MNVANEVYELLGKWAMAQRIKQDGGLGYGQSCLAGMGEVRCTVHALLPRGVHDLAGAFVLEFEFVARHYGCSEAERAEMREIAERDLVAAGECFAYLAAKIRREKSR